MQVASRPRFTTGVALVGASLVVASTVAPVADVHLPDIHLPAIRTMDVDLTAAVNPLAIYSQVLHDALTNVSTLAENAKPGQVLQAILANQLNSAGTLGAALGATSGAVGGALAQLPQTVQTAVGQLAAGNVAGAANALLQIPLTLGLPLQNILPALATIITKPLENIVNVVKAFTGDTLGTELILAGFIGPLISTPAAAATAVQNVITAVGTGNPMAVVGALLGAPATVADGLLNGGYGPDLGPLVDSPFPVKAGGLLSSSTLVFNPDGSFFVNTGGPIAALQAALAKIAGALAPKTPVAVKTADVASVPSTAATTVTVSTGVPAPTKEAATAVEATAPKPSSNGSTTSESPSTTTDSKSQTASTTKPTVTSVDVTSGNKVEPKPASGSDVTKAGDATESPTQEATTEKTDTSSAADAAPSGSAAKSVEKSAGTAKHAKAK
ncbi:hypothetical protein GGC64_004019 [Mycobacterium sp. OAS707]|uniref:hypothetical protein n=1 Tax=Mycobacterium sp. OAS707 TaxID=2663822 RepID=UPI00178A244E|nr:hypothetical protein [Mycobacterium sp. OAS707]MBE1549979.1 hypothetical protein [Mycobacterium sp. OAS707]